MLFSTAFEMRDVPVSDLLEVLHSGYADIDLFKTTFIPANDSKNLVQRNEEKFVIANELQKRVFQKHVGFLNGLAVHHKCDFIKLLHGQVTLPSPKTKFTLSSAQDSSLHLA